MKAMILAAGRGERMRPLTDTTPKPLLQIAGKTLLAICLEHLKTAGFTEIVINVAYLGQQIKDYCGNGQGWGVAIAYSDEGEQALETAGGIAKALPLLGPEPFLVVNADIIFDYDLACLRHRVIDQAHLVMIDNPPHHPNGDFCLRADGRLSETGECALTFSGIGVYHPDLFANILPGQTLKLRPVLNQAMQAGRVTGEYFSGLWLDIGTPERLQSLSDSGLPEFCTQAASNRPPAKF